MDDLLPLEAVAQRILLLRGQKVLLDEDLATLYGVETKRLNEQVRRNRERFPMDFAFELTTEEFANLKSQFATSSWGGRRKLPMAFTEHGAIMAASVLNSAHAVEVSVYVVRAFVQMRELVGNHQELARRLDALEARTEALALQHESFSRETRQQLRQVFEALRALMAPPDPPRRPIGFVPPKDRGPRAQARLNASALRNVTIRHAPVRDHACMSTQTITLALALLVAGPASAAQFAQHLDEKHHVQRGMQPEHLHRRPPPVIVAQPVLPPAYTVVWIDGIPYYYDYINGVYYLASPAPGSFAAIPPGLSPAFPAPPSQIQPRGQTVPQTATDRDWCNKVAAAQPGASRDLAVLQRAFANCMQGRGYGAR